MKSTEATATDAGSPTGDSWRCGWQRWMICLLLFLATTINYIDRRVIGILKPTLEKELDRSEIEYSNIVFAFQTAFQRESASELVLRVQSR